ncbi:MAG: TetR family transcriptional regulator [Thermovirgaceae bacterium]|nr:TetR family transcriptional regulator [Thermovirgaceae bacterium]
MELSFPTDARSRILEAGRVLFAQQGYSRVTVRAITTSAGVNQAMISYYFGGKEALYGEVLTHEASCILSLIDHENLSSLPPRERLKFFAESISSLHGERPWIANLVHQEMVWPTRFLDETLVPAIGKLSSFLRETIREGAEKGDFRPGLDCPLAVYALIAMVNYRNIFRPLVSRIFPMEDDKTNKMDELLDIFFHGVDARDN